MKVGVIGASGYVGGELLRLLVTHPQVTINVVTSRQHVGEYVHRAHPSLKGFIDITFSAMDLDKIADSCDSYLFRFHMETRIKLSKIYMNEILK